MKLSFFVAAMLGVIGLQSTQAISLEAASNAIDFSDYELAEIGGAGEGDGEAAPEAEGGEAVNGVTVRLGTPNCQADKPVPFENQMLSSLNKLGSKSMELHNALKIAFERNQKMLNTKTVKLSGGLDLTKIIDNPPEEPKKTVSQPVIKIAASTTPCTEPGKDAKPADKPADPKPAPPAPASTGGPPKPT